MVSKMPRSKMDTISQTPKITIEHSSPLDVLPKLKLDFSPDLSFEDEVRKVSLASGQPDSDDDTILRDSDFQLSSIKDVFDCVDNEVDSTNLARYLPAKIVQETRNKVRDSLRLGCEQDGFDALETGLERLKNQAYQSSDYWKFGQAELLLDMGKKEEARKLLAHCDRRTRQARTTTEFRRPKPNQANADAEFEKMMKLAKQEELLDLSLRAEAWEEAKNVAGHLHRINYSYFDVKKPMDRFRKCRQLLNLGLLAEIRDPKGDTDRTRKFLGKALRIYNHGCYAIELFHEHFDQPEAIVSGFDHIDCANLFFSAARVCIYFDKQGVFDKHGTPLTPESFTKVFKRSPMPCSPPLKEKNWRHQALQFLEQGRSRALLDSIVKGENFVTPMQRGLLIDDFVFTARESIRLKREGSSIFSSPNSRSSSMSGAVSPTDSNDSFGFFGRDESDSDRPSTLSTAVAHRFRTSPPLRPVLNTIGMDQYAIVDTPSSSPISVLESSRGVDSEETQKRLRRIRVRMRWRKAMLYAFASKNITLNAALPNSNCIRDIEKMVENIPEDTVVIEYSLVSASPTGLMTLVITSAGVVEASWQEANVLVIQRQIAALRDSMVQEAMYSPTSSTRNAFQMSPTSSRRDSVIPDLETLETLLFATLVRPIEKHLDSKKNLIIVPSGDLAHVPWIMLFNLPVTVVPSLSIWNRLHSHSGDPRRPPTKVSIVSNSPRNEFGALRDIPYSRMEAFYIAKLHEQLPFISDDHDRAEFDTEAGSTQVLHLCAHSSFDHDDPMRSSIQLFKEPLTISEWHNLAIKADLVVFSSCLSGISKAFDSGSTFGFAHTLLATGTRAFIGSLWPVEDDATLLLMMMFYEELRRPVSPAQALHNAQQQMRCITDEELWVLVAKLKKMVNEDHLTDHYIHNPRFWVNKLSRDLDAAELREPRSWAAFVLTGYGFKPIYSTAPLPEPMIDAIEPIQYS